MFDENFSFVSSTSTTYNVHPNHCTSADISPFTSRSPSPRLSYTSESTYNHSAQRDSRFNTYRAPRKHSVTTLTAQFESHRLTPEKHSTVSSSPTATAGTSDSDEGFYDGPDTPSSISDCSDYDTSIWDQSMRDLNLSTTSCPTSSVRPSLSLEAQSISSYTQRRRQRQALVRLQCLAKRAPDLAMLIEECHPSSIPLSPESTWLGASRSNSSTSLNFSGCTGGRVEKAGDRGGPTSVRRTLKIRKRATK